MENQVEVMTYAQLKEIMQVLEDTKVFIDTGWDSVQEVAPDAVSIEKVAKFTVADVLTNESFAGYSLEEKAEKMNAEGDLETAIIIRNLY